MSLQQLDRDLWSFDFPFKVGGLAIGGRSTIVREPSGLVLISPGPISDDAAAAISALGPVTAIVAPNLMHHLFVPPARARFGSAKLYAPAGLTAKQPSLTIDGPPEAAASDTLQAIGVGGMPKLQETVFVHRPSRTLIAADLVFNVRAPAPLFTRLFMRFNGGFDRFGPTKICRSLIKDRAAVRAGIDRILATDFDRVVVGHGQILAAGGHDALRDGFAWLAADAARAA